MAFTKSQHFNEALETKDIDTTQTPLSATKPSVIHLCEWYLTKMTRDKKSFQFPAKSAKKVSNLSFDDSIAKNSKTQADLISGLDFYFLREFVLLVRDEMVWDDTQDWKGRQLGKNGGTNAGILKNSKWPNDYIADFE